MQDFVLYGGSGLSEQISDAHFLTSPPRAAGDGVQVEKLQVPPSRVGPARATFSSLRGIAINDFSSLIDRALQSGCDEEVGS